MSQASAERVTSHGVLDHEVLSWRGCHAVPPRFAHGYAN